MIFYLYIGNRNPEQVFSVINDKKGEVTIHRKIQQEVCNFIHGAETVDRGFGRAYKHTKIVTTKLFRPTSTLNLKKQKNRVHLSLFDMCRPEKIGD